MAKSTKSSGYGKPDKPHKDYPLFAQSNGQWAKTPYGKFHYFGVWDDPVAALAEWLRAKR
jgi:hypothetical protein